MHPRMGMGPFLVLGKRPGADPVAPPPPMGPRPSIVGFPRRRPTTDTTTNSGATLDRQSLMPWRYR